MRTRRPSPPSESTHSWANGRPPPCSTRREQTYPTSNTSQNGPRRSPTGLKRYARDELSVAIRAELLAMDVSHEHCKVQIRCSHSRKVHPELENLQNRSISSSRSHAEKSIHDRHDRPRRSASQRIWTAGSRWRRPKTATNPPRRNSRLFSTHHYHLTIASCIVQRSNSLIW